MNEPDPIEGILSRHRLAEASPELRERVLAAATEAWANAEQTEPKNVRPFPSLERSPWWQFAAAAVLVLFTGLNAIHSAANLTAAREPAPPPIARMADAEAEALADKIGLAPGDLKRMANLGPAEIEEVNHHLIDRTIKT